MWFILTFYYDSKYARALLRDKKSRTLTRSLPQENGLKHPQPFIAKIRIEAYTGMERINLSNSSLFFIPYTLSHHFTYIKA